MSSRRGILFVTTLLASCLSAAGQEIPVLTVCEALKDLEGLHGKLLVIVGRSVSTGEGSWLGEDCGIQLVVDGREFQPLISTSDAVAEFDPPPQIPPGFLWNERILTSKLEQIRKTTKLRVYKDRNYNDRWLAMFGRLETRRARIPTANGGYRMIIGFGHLGAAPALLVPARNGWRELRSN